MCIAEVVDDRNGYGSPQENEYKRDGSSAIISIIRKLAIVLHSTYCDTMKSQISFTLLFAVAVQTQFIGGYHDYPLPAAASVQWLPQGQLGASNFYAYPVQLSNYYRDIAGNTVNSWSYFNPIVQVDDNALNTAATVDPKFSVAPVRPRRQIQLRYSNAARRGRSLNDPSSSETSGVSTHVRNERQIQLRYSNAARRGRSLNDPSSGASTPVRKERQIQLRYRGASRRGRSVNDIPSFEAYDKFDVAPVRKERQIQLRYRNGARRRIGRSL